LAVEKPIHGVAHLLQGQVAIHVPLNDAPGFRRWLKPLDAHAGKRVLNFSLALYPRLIESGYGHLTNLLNTFLFYQLTRGAVEQRSRIESGERRLAD
jgi:hypothetical protein